MRARRAGTLSAVTRAAAGLLVLSGCLRWSASLPLRRASASFQSFSEEVRQQFRGAGAVPAQLPVLVCRRHVRRHRYRRAGAGRDHVDRGGQSLHPQRLSRIPPSTCDRPAGSADGKWVSLIVKFGALSSSFSCRCNTRSTCNFSAGFGLFRRCRLCCSASIPAGSTHGRC